MNLFEFLEAIHIFREIILSIFNDSQHLHERNDCFLYNLNEGARKTGKTKSEILAVIEDLDRNFTFWESSGVRAKGLVIEARSTNEVRIRFHPNLKKYCQIKKDISGLPLVQDTRC